jgi:HEXXH motif-containing protein
MPPHRLSRAVFAALATGGGGSQAVRDLAAAQYSKHLTLLRGVLASAQGTEQYPLVLAGYELLDAARQVNRAAADKVIGYPSVGAWARRTIQAYRGGPALPGAEPAGLRAVAAAAAIRAGLAAEIEVPVIGRRVILPSLGAAIIPEPTVTAMVCTGGGGVNVGPVEIPQDPHRNGQSWQGLRRVRTGSLDVIIDDLDPFRMPGVPGLAVRQADVGWDVALQRIWTVLEQHNPVSAAEIAAAASVVVPHSRPPAAMASATSPEAFGAIAMSYPEDPVTGAELLVHEIQHAKLGALMDIVTLTLPDDGQSYYVPWRDDPRPLGGLLQGAYAFLGVAGFWRQQHLAGCPEADAIYARLRTAVARAIEMLRRSGRLTETGLDFVYGMGCALAPWLDEPLPAEAERTARQIADSHQVRWQSSHG